MSSVRDHLGRFRQFTEGERNVRDRYRGCLLGLACGDALGGPVEFRTREQIRAEFPGGLRDFTGGGWLHLAPGEITDDTQMMLAIAESLVAKPELDMSDIAARFVAWMRSDPKDIGNTTRAAIARLASGVPWDVAGAVVAQEMGDRGAGNGAVMRCAPVALRFRGQAAALVSASRDTARITHADRRCVASAIAINQAIAHLLCGGDRGSVQAAAIAGIDDAGTCAAILGAAELAEPDVPNSGFVLDTVTAAFWALLNRDSLEETIVAAVALGGDADTAGAVAGALAGAQYGGSAIPERWLELLQYRARIEQLADRLFELNSRDRSTGSR